MASTYENDLRLEEMATGENSGSWGTKTNNNLELVADAFSYGTEIIADADTAITIADGAADAARSLALKINSSEDLTTTRVVTLGPNTTSKVWIIENNTSGGQTLTISAGSGSNITLANGTTKIIATDGIGAGSNVVELTQDIAIADLSVDGILSLADGTNSAPSLTNTGDTNTGLYFPAADEVGITVGGTQRLNVSATGIDVTGTINGDDIILSDADTPSITLTDTTNTLTTLIQSGNSTGIVGTTTNHDLRIQRNGADIIDVLSTGIDITGTLTSDGLTVDGVGSLTSSSTELLDLTSTGGDSLIRFGSLNSNFDVRIGSPSNPSTANGSFVVRTAGDDRLNIANNGDITFFDASGNASFVYDESAGSTFNEQGADRDFRVESDSNANMIFVDAASDNVVIGSNAVRNSGDGLFQVGSILSAGNIFSNTTAIIANPTAMGTAAGSAYRILQLVQNTSNGTALSFNSIRDSAGSDWTTSAFEIALDVDNSSNIYRYQRFRVGEVVMNPTGAAGLDFRVESNGNTHALFVDAGNNQVVVGTSSPITGIGAAMTIGGLSDTRLAIDGSNSSGLYLSDSGAQGITIRNSSGDLEFYGVASREFVFNEGGIDTDFRVEGSGNTAMIFVDASADRVMFGGATNVENSRVGVLSDKTTSGIGIIQNQLGVTDTSDMAAGVGGGVTFNGRYLSSGGFTNFGSIEAKKSNGTSGQYGGQVVIKARRHGGDSEERISFDQTATVVNQDGHDNDFRVESDNETHALFVEAGEDRVGINNSNPSYTLQVGDGSRESMGIGWARHEYFTVGIPSSGTRWYKLANYAVTALQGQLFMNAARNGGANQTNGARMQHGSLAGYNGNINSGDWGDVGTNYGHSNYYVFVGSDSNIYLRVGGSVYTGEVYCQFVGRANWVFDGTYVTSEP